MLHAEGQKPVVSRWEAEGWLSEEIAGVTWDSEKRSISFMTNKTGTFALTVVRDFT